MAASPSQVASPPGEDFEKRNQTSLPGSQGPKTVTDGIDIDCRTSAQVHEQTLTSSSEPDKSGNPNPSITVSAFPDERDNVKAAEKDKDKSSLAATTNTMLNTTETTTTASSTTGRRLSRKSKSKPVNSSTASTSSARSPPGLAPSTEESKVMGGSQRVPKKESFFSKLFRKLVPCITPSQRAHDVELDNGDAARNHSAGSSNPGVEEPAVPSEKQALTGESNEKEQEQVASAPIAVPKDVPVVAIPPEVDPAKAPPPSSEVGGVTSGAVQTPGSTASDIHPSPHSEDVSHSPTTDSEGSFTDDEGSQEGGEGEAEDFVEEDTTEALIRSGGAGIPIGPDGTPQPLLPPIAPQHVGRKCLVLDLDETLVHSSFKPVQRADFLIAVEIDFHWHNMYVLKRPGVEDFLKKMGEIYEVVVFTASVSKYADPLLDQLDIDQAVAHRLFRESCLNHKGNYIKDLSQLGRPIADTIILDNSPASYIFHPNNAVPVSSWFNDPHDTELTDLCPFLADLADVQDVRGIIDGRL